MTRSATVLLLLAAALISNVARNKNRTDAIEAAQRQIESYDARIEHARGNQKRQSELRKRREHWVNHLKKLKGKAHA